MKTKSRFVAVLMFVMIISITFSFPTIHAESYDKEIFLEFTESEKTDLISTSNENTIPVSHEGKFIFKIAYAAAKEAMENHKKQVRK